MWKKVGDTQQECFLRILLSIQTDFSCAFVCMVLILPLIFTSSSLFPRFLESVTRVLTTMDTILSFYNVFSSLARSMLLFNFRLPSLLIDCPLTWGNLQDDK